MDDSVILTSAVVVSQDRHIDNRFMGRKRDHTARSVTMRLNTTLSGCEFLLLAPTVDGGQPASGWQFNGVDVMHAAGVPAGAAGGEDRIPFERALSVRRGSELQDFERSDIDAVIV